MMKKVAWFVVLLAILVGGTVSIAETSAIVADQTMSGLLNEAEASIVSSAVVDQLQVLQIDYQGSMIDFLSLVDSYFPTGIKTPSEIAQRRIDSEQIQNSLTFWSYGTEIQWTVQLSTSSGPALARELVYQEGIWYASGNCFNYLVDIALVSDWNQSPELVNEGWTTTMWPSNKK